MCLNEKTKRYRKAETGRETKSEREPYARKEKESVRESEMLMTCSGDCLSMMPLFFSAIAVLWPTRFCLLCNTHPTTPGYNKLSLP